MGVIESGARLRFTLKTRKSIDITWAALGNEFERDGRRFAFATQQNGAIDHASAATSQQRL
jgi:hypothetical protein